MGSAAASNSRCTISRFGAGNLLGEQQSGQITAVGFELYTEMMQKAVNELGEVVAPEVEPEIRLEIPAYFPESYIPDANQRLLFTNGSRAWVIH